jgi:hypothetical protein
MRKVDGVWRFVDEHNTCRHKNYPARLGIFRKEGFPPSTPSVRARTPGRLHSVVIYDQPVTTLRSLLPRHCHLSWLLLRLRAVRVCLNRLGAIRVCSNRAA